MREEAFGLTCIALGLVFTFGLQASENANQHEEATIPYSEPAIPYTIVAMSDETDGLEHRELPPPVAPVTTPQLAPPVRSETRAALPTVTPVTASPSQEEVESAVVRGPYWDSSTVQCESNGNWQAVSASGKYHGGLQFDQQTWDAHGGQQYAARADLATPEQQQEVASRVQYDAWPNC